MMFFYRCCDVIMPTPVVIIKRIILGGCLLTLVLHLDLDVDPPKRSLSYSTRRMAVKAKRDPVGLRRPNCQLLFEGDKTETDYTKQFLNQTTYKPPPDKAFVEATKDCDAYKRGRYYLNVSLEERNFPLAFGIRMHHNVAQAEQLLRTLYVPHNVYCIYIDRKSGYHVHRAMESIAKCFDNVFIASHLHKFTYGSFSPAQADLQCMQDLLSTTVPWKYFINVAGSEFPLKTNLEMVRILSVLNGTNDVEQYPFPAPLRHRWQKIHATVNNGSVATKRRKQPFSPSVTLQKGCSYNLFSRQFIKWVLTNETAQRFVNWTMDTGSPDEMIWATLNSMPGAPGGYPVMVTQIAKTFLAREVIWTWSVAYCFGRRFVHSICILSSGDLERLSRRWELFANKFDPEFDHVVLDCLEERHRNRTFFPDPDSTVNWDMIRRAPHVAAAISKTK